MNDVFEKARGFIQRNARPVDFARWQFHFEHGTQEAVLHALASYQNADGGFGHALEPDAWNPDSSPIQTWTATEILREIGWTDARHPLVQGILRYLESGQDFNGRIWYNSVPGNNHHPHATWWHWREDAQGLERDYNPTACLAGFLVRHAEAGSPLHALGCRIAREAFQAGQEEGVLEEMHTLHCYVRLWQYVSESGRQDLFDLEQLKGLLLAKVKAGITADTAAWATDYVCMPSRFIRSKESLFYEDSGELAQLEAEHLQRTQQPDGSWTIPWSWGTDAEAFAISRNWWKSIGILDHLLFLKGLERL